ncbi:MAG: acyl-CoA dehydrogenase family protein [Chloroflexi bacterium]|nr:acyl-CoA dehydrogenase family protein [Chloroflexota bacterium]MCI0814284.1 acyl-CoA dehydrogenase family protein [Chloroflexota bacterium]MCI0819042.1 acyl-CoA dehydrogenase family protein [Chloroflexota bacterium]MCI0883883.1 acyl-CoA dehydrogenase family protein [Chloroflexota bacterium]
MADFTMTPEIKELRTDVRAFMDEFVYPNEEVIEDASDDQAQDLIKDLQGRTKKMGYWAPHLPKEAGGMGIGFMPYVYMNEILGRSFLAPRAFGAQAPDSGNAEILWQFGSDDQKAKWLKPLVNGDIRSCFSMTEPEVPGSDPTTLQTQAVRDGDDWVINGHKWFTSGAMGAEFAIVMCVTDPDGDTHRKMSQIIVPLATDGVDIVRSIPVMGDTRGNHCEIYYKDVRVPVTNVLGQAGDGFMIAQKRLGPGRIHHCMRWLGQMSRAFDMLCERALSRSSFGTTLAQKQTVQNWIADSVAEIQSARLLTLHAANKIDQGDEARVEVSLIKFWGAKILHDVIDRAIQVHGALGVSGDTPLESMYRQARAARIYDGPDEVHRMVVARRVLREYSGGAGWEFE